MGTFAFQEDKLRALSFVKRSVGRSPAHIVVSTFFSRVADAQRKRAASDTLFFLFLLYYGSATY